MILNIDEDSFFGEIFLGDFESGQMAHHHFFTKHMGLDGIVIMIPPIFISGIYCRK